MTLTTTVDRSGPYTGNGVTTVFAYGFKITAESQLIVYDVTVQGGEVAMSTSLYTVSGVGNASGGNVTFAVAPVADLILQPRREVPLDQTTDYQDEAIVRPVQIETDLDKFMMAIQQVQGQLGLPFPPSRALSYLFFDENGDLVTTGTAPNGQYLGAFTTAGEPTTKATGAALGVGDWYFNTTTSLIRVWTGAAFSNALETGSAIDITGMTAETVMAAADVLPFYDDDAAANRKVTVPNLYRAINILTALAAAPAVGDKIGIYDLSATAGKSVTIQNLLNALTNMAALTAPALADTIALYDDSASATVKITPDNLLKVINLLTVDSSPDLAADYVPVYDASAGSVKRVLLNKIGVGSFGTALLHVREEQTSGTDAGTFTSGSPVKRTLNTVKTNEISGASVTASVITLPIGTYWMEADAPAHEVQGHVAWLQNTSDAAIELVGKGMSVANNVQSNSTVRGRFTIAAPKTFELQHQAASTKATDGLGEAIGIAGVLEVYSEVMIWKVG